MTPCHQSILIGTSSLAFAESPLFPPPLNRHCHVDRLRAKLYTIGVRPVPIIASVSMFTVGYAIDATYRRLELPPEERFRVPYRKWLAQTRQVAFHPESRAWF